LNTEYHCENEQTKNVAKLLEFYEISIRKKIKHKYNLG